MVVNICNNQLGTIFLTSEVFVRVSFHGSTSLSCVELHILLESLTYTSRNDKLNLTNPNNLMSRLASCNEVKVKLTCDSSAKQVQIARGLTRSIVVVLKKPYIFFSLAFATFVAFSGGQVQTSCPIYIHIRICKPSYIWFYREIISKIKRKKVL
jgi:hypothetical protein